MDPASSILIFSESIYFLDIVEIAFENMDDPVPVVRYDGRAEAHVRGRVLEQFKEPTTTTTTKVMLITRAAGGIALNIATANCVIICEPWWKRSLEIQAYKRAWRQGQTRPVSVVYLKAEDCDVEALKARTRDRKNKHNTKIMEMITRKDGVRPKVPRVIR